MGECEKCGVSIRKPRKTITGRHNGKPIFRVLCRRCKKEVNEENEK